MEYTTFKTMRMFKWGF